MLSIRLGVAPLGEGGAAGVYVAQLYAPDRGARTEERYVAAVVVMPTKIVARPVDLVPEGRADEVAREIGRALERRFGGGEAARIAEAAGAALSGAESAGGIPPPAIWTSRKDGRPTLHVAWPSCTFSPCGPHPVEVTVPATWIAPST